MPKKRKVESKLIPMKLIPEVTESTPQYYANFAEVSHSAYDFSLTFAKLPTRLTSDQRAAAKAGEPVHIEPLMQIIIPAKLIQGMIEALMTEKTKYERHFGAIEPLKNIRE